MSAAEIRSWHLSGSIPSDMDMDMTSAVDETGHWLRPGADEGPRFAPGAVVNGRYTVEKVLGEGAMGLVYAVTDQLHPDRSVALKTIRGSVIGPAQVGMFKAEFSLMTELSHPNVERVYDFEPIQGSDEHLFTMELVEGQDAFHTTEGGEWETVVDVVVQVCRALSYVHSREIIHFDLKPANVMVAGDGSVKVLDFGVAGRQGGASRRESGARPTTWRPSWPAPMLRSTTGSTSTALESWPTSSSSGRCPSRPRACR